VIPVNRPDCVISGKRLLILSLLTTLVFGGANAVAAPQAKSQQTLDQVLDRMASVGRTFRSFQAEFTQKKYVSVLKEFDEPETGVFLYARAKDGSALLRQETRVPAPKILTIKGGVITVYQPRIKSATVANMGKNKDKAEYLALGIGQSPAKLRETFNIEYEGTEPVDGAPCSVLVLKPKSSNAAAFFAAITLWIKNSNNLPVQQKLQEPSGDYLLVKFTAEKFNPKVSESQFEQKLPRGVEIQSIR